MTELKKRPPTPCHRLPNTGRTARAWPGSGRGVRRGRSLIGCPRLVGVALSWRAYSPGTVTRSGSRGVCPARSSAALLARPRSVRDEESALPWQACGDRYGSAQAVGDDRGARRARARCWRRAGSAPTATATRRLLAPGGGGRSGCGRSRAATASAGTWRSGWSPTARPVVDVPAKLSARVAGVLHRAGPQDRRHRRALGRRGRAAHPGSAAGAGRRRDGRAAAAGRPPRRARRGPHPDGRTGCTGCWWSWCRVGRRSSCPRPRRERCWPPCGRGTWSGRTRRQLAAELVAELGGDRQADQDREKRARRTRRRRPAAACSTSTASARPAPPGCSATSATSPGSRPGRTSRPGTAPPRSTPPPASRTATGSPAPATGGSTGCCTSWPIVQLRHDTDGRAYYRRKRRRRQDPDGSDALPQTTTVRRRLPAARRRPEAAPAGPVSERAREDTGGDY